MATINHSILVVDDTPANISLLLDTLADRYQLFVAEDGRSCIDQLPHCQPDLILLDVKMPGMDGFALCRYLKQQPLYAEIPVLFMTAVDDPGQKEYAFDLGAVDYVTKPIYVPEVLARVASHLSILSLTRELQAKVDALETENLMRREIENQLQASLDQAIIAVHPNRHIVFATELAKSLLHRYMAYDGSGLLPDSIPFPEHIGSSHTIPHPRNSNSLLVNTFLNPNQPNVVIFQLHESIRQTPAIFRQLGLSPRECEVLFWMAEGKTYPEIATILQASVRTVQKHAENILRKLNVETRAAAMRLALDIL